MHVKVFFLTYGCTLNRAYEDIMRSSFSSNGFIIVDREEDADVVVVNSCGVKETTENKIVHKIKTLESLGKRIVVAGCLSANINKIRRYTHAPVLLPYSTGNIANAVVSAYFDIPDLFYSQNTMVYPAKLTHENKKSLIYPVAISDGCLGNCTYCFTKVAKPKLKSFPKEWVMSKVENALSNGAVEIDLTSVDTGAYGKDIGSNLCDLLKDVLSIPGSFMIRLGMINPQHALAMSRCLVDIFTHSKMFKFLHVPVQTGSERVCMHMRRSHSVSDFVNVVSLFRKHIPDITISTDIIVGYPTETNEDFEKTVELVKTIKPDVVNISKYSPRPMTEASKLRQIPTNIKKERSSILSAIVKDIELEKNTTYVGKVLDVVFLSEHCKYVDGRFLHQVLGRTRNYKQVVVNIDSEDATVLGRWMKVKITNASYTSLFGYIYEHKSD